ncbi:peptidoglycan DD-metalloendopeptidase family protein [Cohnella sp. CFH 77786]|uniref:M23 family metallopeptidase n=1 Tax=Cohnella sp. CFH 77786 TaxID=2662265 RepID=UPI001C60ADB3|nr:M23 family metallopeptidase [Cohnella sp. CFH 77786]MBW5445911.1 peptidoglycan DD-metalloendopeptidase family protein [Cohnella sp. CFH 77786]
MNNEGNKTTRKIDESPKSVAGSVPAKPSGWKKLLSKRWVFPAAYMAAAAIIVTILWLNAGGQGKDADQSVPGQASVETGAGAEETASPDAAQAAANGETLRWPVDKFESFKTVMAFYDASAPEEERQAALIERDNQFTPHTAVDLARIDAKDFNVLAALSGEVTVAEQTPVNGYEVRIKHGNGLETVYQSLKDIKVQVGQQVEQGDVIGSAGQSPLETAEGIHVHFEVLSNGTSVNPASMIKTE